MSLTYTRSTRDLDIKGVITFRDGTQKSLTSADIVDYSISESVGGEGLALGTAESASYSLTLADSDHVFSAKTLDNAEIHVYIGISTNNEVVYSDFGVWYVHSVQTSEQSTSVTISGYDALSTLFGAVYTDSKSAYPTTIASLLTTICTAAGVRLKSSTFPNSAVKISSLPNWQEETTLREIVGYCAACAGGFAQMSRDGKLEIVSYVGGETYSFGADMYTDLSEDGGNEFAFNAIEVKFSEDDEDYSRYAVDSSIEDNATNTIQIESNPLMTKAIVRSLVTEFTGLIVQPVKVSWVGDPVVHCGDILQVTDLKNVVHSVLINSNNFSFDGGLSATSSATLPTLNSTEGSSYTTSGNLMDSNGNIKATRISGLDKSVVSATSAHFESLSASTVQTDRLLAALINATNLKAENIDVTSAEIDNLTATIANIVKATIDKIEAGTITTDTLIANIGQIVALRVKQITAETITTDELGVELAKITDLRAGQITSSTIDTDTLAAKIAEVIQLKVDKIDAKTISTDELGAALAKFTVLSAGTSTFDLSTITNLLSNALILKQGIADSMMITNLSVTSANLLNATVDKLVLKSSDGKYYHVFVGSDGSISTDEITVTQEEIDAGQTSDGRQITATTANVSELNSQTVKAKEAVIGTIVTESLTAGKITATEAVLASAVIPIIYTDTIKALGSNIDISANTSITSTVTSVEAVSDAVETATSKVEVLLSEVGTAQTAAETAQATADEAAEAMKTLQTQVTQTNDALSVVQTTTTDLEGRVTTIESGVHISGSEIEIYASDSPYHNKITNDGWEITENGTAVITCAETKLTAPRIQVTDAMIIGNVAWKPGSDNHLRLLKYGR